MKRALKIAAIPLALVLLILGVPVYNYFPGHNLRVVEPGAWYGSRQMSGPAIERYAKKYGIKTILNFRGENPGSSWYDDEVAACKRLGIEHVDFGWSRNDLPEPESLKAYLQLLETGKKPFLAHCQGGTHRTGAAAAVYLLWKGESPETARGQFGPAFNNAPIGELVTLYERSGMPFKQYVAEKYAADYAAWKEARK